MSTTQQTVSQRFGINGLKSDPVFVPEQPAESCLPFIPSIKPDYKIGLERFRDLYEFDGNGYKDGALFITGPRGSGKSSGVEQYYARWNRPVYRATGHARMELTELLGFMGLVNGDTVFKEGPLTQAAKYGGVFLLDEGDVCPPEILVGLNGILEMGDKFVLGDNGGEVVKVHPKFRVIITGNTAGSGDSEGQYAGTVIQNSATLDRFNFLFWGYPDEQMELEILMGAIPAYKALADFGKTLIHVANATRVEGGVEDISTRTLIRWARKAIAFKGEPIQKSLDRAFAFRLEESERKEIYAIAAAYFGEGFYQ